MRFIKFGNICNAIPVPQDFGPQFGFDNNDNEGTMGRTVAPALLLISIISWCILYFSFLFCGICYIPEITSPLIE
jgi:hypothetical protein